MLKDLNEIVVFTRVAQLGSFSKASKALATPVSTVSRKVSDLEERLGTTLILRTTRKLSLTKKGLEFYEQCASHIQGLEEAEALLTQGLTQAEGLLRISVPVIMGRGLFIDFVSDFLKRHPKIQIDLLITNQFVDLVSENVDVAIRFGALQDSSLIAKRLGWSRSFLVASPKYLQKHGNPHDPKQLIDHDCVIFKGRKPASEWELTNEKNKVRVKVSGVISGSDFSSVNEFALRGHGIALLPEVYCFEAIKSGQLVRVLPQWGSPASPVHAVYLSRKFMPGKMQVFLKDLLAWKNPNWK